MIGKNYMDDLPYYLQDKIWNIYYKDKFKNVLKEISKNIIKWDEVQFISDNESEPCGLTHDEYLEGLTHDEYLEEIGCRWSRNMNKWTMWSDTDSDDICEITRIWRNCRTIDNDTDSD